jgi:hypothetical protein
MTRDEIERKIEYYSELHDEDPLLIKALVGRESSYDPKAKSKAGAMGLGQLMPGTAGDLGVTDPFDVDQNLDGTVRYIKQLRGMFDNDLEKVLAAYNYGMGNVRKRGLDWIKENISETSNYITNVLGDYNEFRGIQRTETAKEIAALGIDPNLLGDPELFSKAPSAIPESRLSTVDSMGFDDFGITYDPIELPYAERPEIGGGYTVNQGDTLYSISQRIGVPVEEIAKRNNIMNNMIFPGQRLLY